MSYIPARTTPRRERPAHRAPSAPTSGLDRRGFLRATGLTVAGTTALGLAGTTPALAAVAPQFAGHKPGKIYLGASSQGDFNVTVARTGPLGLRRTYYRWGDITREIKNIKQDHAVNRMPWISFKPASTARGGWAAIAAGRHDGDIRARARAYAGLSRPVIVTFNHEPHNDSTGTPAEFAKAASRVYDVLTNETGRKNVVYAPIIGDWAFNPVNKRQAPEDFLTGELLNRTDMLGIDLYQNRSGQGYDVRVARVIEFLNARGHSQTPVGLGETGCTMDYSNPNGVDWWKKSWTFAANSGRIAAISYFNSQYNNNSGNTWLLWETSAKLAAFKASLSSSVSTRL